MSMKMPKPPEGAKDLEPVQNGETETVELEAGDVLYGPVLDIEEGEGQYGPWFLLTIKDDDRGVVDYFAKDEVKTACKSGQLERGDTAWIARGVEEAELSTGGTYLPTFCKIMGDD
jgi:hypothetical protein